MKDWLRSKLRDPLTQLELESRRRLELAGISSTQKLHDIAVHVPQSRKIIVEELGIPEKAILTVLGKRSWPRYVKFQIPGNCVLGGLRTLPGEPDAATLSAVMSTLGKAAIADGLPDHVFFTDRFGPIRNQGGVGSCHSFATIHAWIGSTSACKELSPAFMFWATKQVDGIPEDGSLLKYNAMALDRFGVCYEQTHPYVPDREYLRRKPGKEAFAEAKALRRRMLNVSVTSAKDTEYIRRKLAVERKCVAVGTPVFASSMNSLLFHQNGILGMRLGASDPQVGGHAWCACGYADNSWLTRNGIREMPGGGGFLIRNSWGIWAPRNPIACKIGAGPGYAVMPYGYLSTYGWEALSMSLVSSRNGWDSAHRATAKISHWGKAAASVVAESATRLELLRASFITKKTGVGQ